MFLMCERVNSVVVKFINQMVDGLVREPAGRIYRMGLWGMKRGLEGRVHHHRRVDRSVGDVSHVNRYTYRFNRVWVCLWSITLKLGGASVATSSSCPKVWSITIKQFRRRKKKRVLILFVLFSYSSFLVLLWLIIEMKIYMLILKNWSCEEIEDFGKRQKIWGDVTEKERVSTHPFYSNDTCFFVEPINNADV